MSKAPYSPMKKAMLITLGASLFMCLVCGLCFQRGGQRWLFGCAVTFGVVAYHMLIRFAAPGLLWLIFRRKYDIRHWWFRQKNWEPKLYELLRVRKWKGAVASYDPSEFDLEKHSLREIAENMCHAEAVHEVIILLSFTSLFFAIPFGDLWVFLLTAVAAACVDGVFTVMQRYNRPRIMMILERRKAGRA